MAGALLRLLLCHHLRCHHRILSVLIVCR